MNINMTMEEFKAQLQSAFEAGQDTVKYQDAETIMRNRNSDNVPMTFEIYMSRFF